jgi:hypothetical protein
LASDFLSAVGAWRIVLLDTTGDLRLLDGALAELAGVLTMDITSYDTGPAADPALSPAPPDPAAEPAPSPPPRPKPGKTIRDRAPDSSRDY